MQHKQAWPTGLNIRPFVDANDPWIGTDAIDFVQATWVLSPLLISREAVIQELEKNDAIDAVMGNQNDRITWVLS
jgi:hypothetical protein